MKNFLPIIILALAACGGPSPEEASGNGQTRPSAGNNRAQNDAVSAAQSNKDGWRRYTNRQLQLKLEYPEDWILLESGKDEPFDVINIYPRGTAQNQELPLRIHAPPDISFVSILPKGFGTEAPAGKKKTFRKADPNIDFKFTLNDSLSESYMLHDGSVWAYAVYPSGAPEAWERHGFVFAQAEVKNFEAECYDKRSEKEKPIERCDPLAGDDYQRYGTVNSARREIVRKILGSVQFADSSNMRPDISELLQVEIPTPDEKIESPLNIEGKAVGVWYFEGKFNLRLVDHNENELASGPATAEGNWMTEGWVPFSATLEFEAPNNPRGYLILEKANPSGEAENARSLRLPLLFHKDN